MTPETISATVTSWLPVRTNYQLYSNCHTINTDHLAGNALLFHQHVETYFTPQVTMVGKGFTVSLEVISLTTMPCHPTVVEKWWDVTRDNGTQTAINTVFSLGGDFVCPYDYTTANIQSLDEERTAIACCPSAFTFVSKVAPGTSGQCTSPVSKNQKFTYTTTPSVQSNYMGQLPQSSSGDVRTYTAAEASHIGGLHVNGVVSKLPALDLVGNGTVVEGAIISTRAPGMNGTSITPTASIAPGIATGQAPSIPSAISSRTLAGIGIGCAFGAIVLCFSLWVFVYRRRHLKAMALKVGCKLESIGSNEYRKELSGEDGRFEAGGMEKTFELVTSQKAFAHELDTYERPQEMAEPERGSRESAGVDRGGRSRDSGSTKS